MQFNELENLRIELRKFVSDRDWNKFHSPKNLAAGLNIESSELLEIFLWLTEDESYNLNEDKLQRLKDEIGDIMIFLLNLTDKFNLNLLDCAREKLEKNKIKYPTEKVKGSAKKYDEYK